MFILGVVFMFLCAVSMWFEDKLGPEVEMISATVAIICFLIFLFGDHT